jgi:hypothetical protein
MFIKTAENEAGDISHYTRVWKLPEKDKRKASSG